MSKSTVITRKDMKEPDSFQTAASQAASWLASRKKHVVVAGAAVVAALLLIAALSSIRARREERAGAATAALLTVIGGEVSSTPVPGLPGPTFPTEEARQTAILQEAEKVIAEFSGAPAAEMARLAKADAQLRLHRWDAAQASYEQYLSGAPKDDSLRFGALQGLALVAEGKGDLAGAAKAYERLASEAPRFADRADLERARVLAQAGKTAEAKELLAAYPDRHKESFLTPEAADRLTKLGGK
ncbi:MAG TPA: hypothetical protein VML50_06950 [Anaeromyxobacter sp.]|nr:hypothetical protein [Anaeromyxobacter sp.]